MHPQVTPLDAVCRRKRREEWRGKNRVQRERMTPSTVSVSIMPEESVRQQVEFYCPRCHEAVTDPLVCGDCSAIICRKCGAPLEKIDELGIG
jgi:peptide subunit release factor 1 (eRF1)